jgi:hypothetical protein
MKTRGFVLFTVFVMAFLLPSLTLVAQQPRAVPSNDSINTPKAIKIGKDYNVSDIGAATNEFDEPVASCNGAAAIANSVWFSFTLPDGDSRVSLSTYGSALFHEEYDSVDTVLAVYAVTAPDTYFQVACADDSNGIPSAQIIFLAVGDITYYIAAGTASDASLKPISTLKLTTRILTRPIIPLNSNFEGPITDPGWIVRNEDTDGVVCSDVTYAALAGSCAFRFTGTAAKTTKLLQTVPFPTDFKARKNALIATQFYVEVLDTAALTNTKVKLIVSYTDGTPNSVRTLNLDGLAALGSYQMIELYAVLKTANVQAIRFQTNFGAASGTLMLDAVYFRYEADPATRGSGLLPVPPSAK